MLFVEGAGALFHLLDGRVRDDLFAAGADYDFTDFADGADDGVGQHHGHAPHVLPKVQLRAHGEEAIPEMVAEEEVGGPCASRAVTLGAVLVAIAPLFYISFEGFDRFFCELTGVY